MLQAEMRDLIAHRKEEVILAIMRRAKERLSFFDELPIFLNQPGRRLQRFISICRNIEIVCRRCTGAQLDPAEVAAGENPLPDASGSVTIRKNYPVRTHSCIDIKGRVYAQGTYEI